MAALAEPIQYDLPPELWSLIFAHLKPQQLLSARLICHRWKTIVDGMASFWNRICLKLDGMELGNYYGVPMDQVERVTLDEHLPRSVAPASKVHLDMVKIVTVDSWWPSFAQRLTLIRMQCCTVSLETFVGMLRRTPNLTQLELCTRITSREAPEVLDFRLEKMKRLQLTGYTDDMLDLFGQLCPHLHELSLEDDGEDHDAATARLIGSVQDTLVRLELWMTPYVLQKMSLMERLQLKSVVIKNLQNDDYALSLSRLQPSLEELEVVIEQNTTLGEIGRNIPGLKRLVVALNEGASLTFHATLPLLEKLDIAGGQEPPNFDGLKCPNLTELTLDHLEVNTSSLRSFLAGSSNLKKLKLPGVALDTWSDLLVILTERSSLRHLDLWFVHFEDPSIPIISPRLQTNLEFLQIYPIQRSFSNEMLLQLTGISPQLTTLKLISMELVDDATVRKLCQQLPRLARLTLSGCSLTVACAGDIVDRCLALEFLSVDNCAALCEEVRKLVQARGDGRCVDIFERSTGKELAEGI